MTQPCLDAGGHFQWHPTSAGAASPLWIFQNQLEIQGTDFGALPTPTHCLQVPGGRSGCLQSLLLYPKPQPA